MTIQHYSEKDYRKMTVAVSSEEIFKPGVNKYDIVINAAKRAHEIQDLRNKGKLSNDPGQSSPCVQAMKEFT